MRLTVIKAPYALAWPKFPTKLRHGRVAPQKAKFA